MPPDGARVVVEPAPAKLNLWLHVVGRRDDGLHLLESLIAFAALGDALAAAPAADLALALEGPFAPALAAEPDNLVLRAARALAVELGRAPAAALRLDKRLPVAAGLGGGSADAAAALRALLRLWDATLPASRLAALAAGLGADVPACLAARPVAVAGTGEILAPAPALPPAGILLVNPRVPLATAEVFAARSGAFSTPAPLEEALRDAAALAAAIRERRNDLTPGAVARAPAIAACLVALERSPGCLAARMSGSGATCFGVYADEEAAASAAAAVAAAGNDWWIAPTRLASA